VLHVLVVLNQAPSQPPPTPPRETLLLNELFRDYLRFNGYEATLSVFLTETAQPPEPAFDRKFLAKEIGITETLTVGLGSSPACTSGTPAPGEGDLPLAYGLLSGYTQVRDMQRTLAPLVQRHHALAATSSYPHATPGASLPPPLPQQQQQQRQQPLRQHQYTSTQFSQSFPKRAADTATPASLRVPRQEHPGRWPSSRELPQSQQEPQQQKQEQQLRQRQQQEYSSTSLYDDHNYGSNLAPDATSAFAPLRTDDLRGVTGNSAGGWPSAESNYESEVNDDAGSGYRSYGNGSGGEGGSGYGSSHHGSEGKTPSPALAESNQGRATPGSVASDSDFRVAARTALPDSPNESDRENKFSDEQERDNGPTYALGGGGLLVIDGASKEDSKDTGKIADGVASPPPEAEA